MGSSLIREAMGIRCTYDRRDMVNILGYKEAQDVKWSMRTGVMEDACILEGLGGDGDIVVGAKPGTNLHLLVVPWTWGASDLVSTSRVLWRGSRGQHDLVLYVVETTEGQSFQAPRFSQKRLNWSAGRRTIPHDIANLYRVEGAHDLCALAEWYRGCGSSSSSVISVGEAEVVALRLEAEAEAMVGRTRVDHARIAAWNAVAEISADDRHAAEKAENAAKRAAEDAAAVAAGQETHAQRAARVSAYYTRQNEISRLCHMAKIRELSWCESREFETHTTDDGRLLVEAFDRVEELLGDAVLGGTAVSLGAGGGVILRNWADDGYLVIRPYVGELNCDCTFGDVERSPESGRWLHMNGEAVL